jgi:hypothetical protein
MTGQVNQYQVSLRCKSADNRVPRLPSVAEAVQEDQRWPSPNSLIDQPHKTFCSPPVALRNSSIRVGGHSCVVQEFQLKRKWDTLRLALSSGAAAASVRSMSHAVSANRRCVACGLVNNEGSPPRAGALPADWRQT